MKTLFVDIDNIIYSTQENEYDYNHYNSVPEGLKEITLEEWTDGMFMYCKEKDESRQARDPFYCDLIMFDVPNFDNKKLGFAIMRDWFDNIKQKNKPEQITRFCRYGLDEDWKRFEIKFAAQFANDNS